MYSTRLKKCVIPHYKQTGGESDELFKNWHINTVFENELDTYEKYGHRMSSAISGMCLGDLFTQYGLTQRDEYVKTLFSTISCYRGKDSIISFLVASRPYRIKNKELDLQPCLDNVVFQKGTLIIPRGELLWALLSIPGDKIGTSNDPNSFRIYIQGVPDKDRIEPIKQLDGEFQTHSNHLGITNISKKEINANPQSRPTTYYVKLNPFIYTKIKAYRCISPEGRNLEEQYFMLHKMNLLYSQSFGAMALMAVEARRLLQYPPGTRESICCERDLLNVGIPQSHATNINRWAIKQEKEQNQNNNDGYDYTGTLPKNTIIFPEATNTDVCKSNRDGFHNFIQQFERNYFPKIREEYGDIKINDNTFAVDYDDSHSKFWFKLFNNTYPSKLTYQGEIISTFSHNCELTAVGVVSTRDICEGDPLIFDKNEMKIDQIHIPNQLSPWECLIEKMDIPEYRKLPDVEKVGETKNLQRVQANPLTYTSAFVTSLGTNITILSKQA